MTLEEQKKQRDEEKQMVRDLAQITADMKAYLKTQSKKELIRLCISQANLVIEHTQLNRHLHEENLELKKQLEPAQPKEQSEAAEEKS